jgi:molybdopterin-guanine dinucleotide biosynthesis protein B
MKEQKIVTVTGKSNSGKTTVIEKLIKHYSAKGLKVSVVKSMKHRFQIDHKGKDTFRYREAGVFSWAITNGQDYAIFTKIDTPLSPLDIAQKNFPDSDIIFIEGFKEGETPKIEVIGTDAEEALFRKDKLIVAVLTDMDMETSVPKFSRDDIEAAAEFINNNF